MAKSNKYKIEKAKKYIRLNKNKIIYLTIFVVYTLAMATFVFINRDVFTDCNQGSISSHMPGEGNAKAKQQTTGENGAEQTTGESEGDNADNADNEDKQDMENKEDKEDRTEETVAEDKEEEVAAEDEK